MSGAMRRRADERGFGLVEILVAMLILVGTLLGVMGVFQWADVGLREGFQATRALAMAESRIEAKRAGPWPALLSDDLDADGVAEIHMRDDGVPPDEQAGDGIFSAGVEQDGIHLTWTVQPDRTALMDPLRAGPWTRVGAVVIIARAAYTTGNGQSREVRVGTLRANPSYVGPR